jgi:hypothetical protein
VVHIRGSSFLSTIRFVKETYGAEAHDRVLAALPVQCAATFLGPMRDASWKPIEDLLAYMETAKALLAPGDAAFHKNVGLFVGHQMARSAFRIFLGSDPLTSISRSAFMWRFLYDAGRVEIASREPGRIVMRIHDFQPPSRAICERVVGFLTGCMDVVQARNGAVRETACVFEGDAYHEWTGTWDI